MIDDAIGEAAAEAAGAVVRHASGFIADLAYAHIFSAGTARFFHGIGRRMIAAVTLGRTRIPSSLRIAPRGALPRPRRYDWLALWVGITLWFILFAMLCLAGWMFL